MISRPKYRCQILFVIVFIYQYVLPSWSIPLSQGPESPQTQYFNPDVEQSQQAKGATSEVSMPVAPMLPRLNGPNGLGITHDVPDSVKPIRRGKTNESEPLINKSVRLKATGLGSSDGTLSPRSPATEELYSLDTKLYCMNPTLIVGISERSYELSDTYGLGSRYYVNWDELLRSTPADMLEIYILSKIDRCKECMCEIGPDGYTGNLKADPLSNFCATQREANICQLIYGCRCGREMKLEKAKGGFPLTHSGRSKPGAFFETAFDTDAPGSPAGTEETLPPGDHAESGMQDIYHEREGIPTRENLQNWRILDPSTREPYFLEGPTKGPNPYWRLPIDIGSSRTGYRGILATGGRGYKGHFWKRENLDIGTPDRSPMAQK
ncbi:hypothetical protein TWF730_005040 [Orbilia blumenaviensis]|uniref:Uncharacterized protein n=1 Tax=Orbilia blumenaviensis TaxID=1796055 RepID=A0AAV9VH29_9PEZI